MSNKYKRILPQLLTLLLIVLIFGFFTFNAQMNMSNRGIDFGYGFLGQESSFDVQFSLIEYDGSHSYARAYLVGLLNTILVSVLGIIFCTIIGVVVGIAPLPENTEPLFGATYLTVKGYFMPGFIWENFNILVYSILAAVISIILIRLYAKKLREEKGQQLPIFLISLALLIVLPALTFVTGIVQLEVVLPVLKQLSKTSFTYEGGVSVPPELIALVLALSLYTATFVAECVRAGIQGISKGQKEAAASVGLTRNQILKLVIMPQALRIIIPPTTNQYLNLTKNSSLAAAIAYPDLVLVFAGTALMQTGRAIEIVSITMLTYLTLSLSISVLMNWYNKKIAIKEK